MIKPNILFVGSFASSLEDGRIGGQMIACHAIVNSRLKEEVNWVLIDTTAVLPIQPVFIRALKATRRLLKLFRSLLFDNISKVLIFSSSGFSLLEKGLMARICNFMNKEVIFAPRSGLILEDLKSPRKKAFIGKVFQASHKVICQGEKWQEKFSQLSAVTQADKYVVIPNWVDTNLYPFMNKENKKDGEIRLLYLGWVKNYKGIFDFLDALTLIKDEIPFLKVDICGNGDDFDKAVSQVKENGLADKVNFHGWINFNQKLTFFEEADFYILPSHFEGFPNALLEAMSAGLPAIATDVGAVSSVLKDKHNGLLIPSKSPTEIAKAVLTLYNNRDLRLKYGFEARKLVEKEFSKGKAIINFRKILIKNG